MLAARPLHTQSPTTHTPQNTSQNTLKKTQQNKTPGLTRRFFDEAQRKVIFAVVFSRLVEAKRGGRAFSAALFWNAAHPSGRRAPPLRGRLPACLPA